MSKVTWREVACLSLLAPPLMRLAALDKFASRRVSFDKVCGMLRSQDDHVRRHEREIRRIAVDRCGMPQKHFIEHFPPNALNLGWAGAEATTARPYSAALCRNVASVQKLQSKLIDLQTKAVMSSAWNPRRALFAEAAAPARTSYRYTVCPAWVRSIVTTPPPVRAPWRRDRPRGRSRPR